MAEASIPVDLFNPGQVFACLGFLEAAEVLIGDAEGMFDWRDLGQTRFVLRTPSAVNGFRSVLSFLANSEAVFLSPRADMHERDGGRTVVQEGISPHAEPRPADLSGEFLDRTGHRSERIPFGWWADGSSRFNTSFKKSTNGASSAVRMAAALRGIAAMDLDEMVRDPFAQAARTTSLFRLDPRGSVTGIEAGFSPNQLRKSSFSVRVVTYPVCEVLAVIGLEWGRPVRLSAARFAYHVWGTGVVGRFIDRPFVPVTLARAGVCGPLVGWASRRFLVDHEEVKKGGDRVFSRVMEDTRYG